MNGNNKNSGLVIAAGLIVTAAVAVRETAVVVAPIVKPTLEKIVNMIDEKITEERNKIILPEIPSPISHITLEEAKQQITNLGLTVGWSVAKAHIAYKDCLEFEVVCMDHKPKQKVNPGTQIILYYVTSEVITASQNLYKDAEQKKNAKKQKQAETMDEIRQKAVGIAASANDSVKDAIIKIKKHPKDILSGSNNDGGNGNIGDLDPR